MNQLLPKSPASSPSPFLTGRYGETHQHHPFLVLLPLLVVVFFGMARFNDALKKAYEEDLEHLVRNLYSMSKSQQEIIQTITGAHPTQEGILRTLKEAMAQIKVGSTGYIYVMDTRGLLQIHPAKEKENILDSTDSSGFKYIRAMIKEALILGTARWGLSDILGLIRN